MGITFFCFLKYTDYKIDTVIKDIKKDNIQIIQKQNELTDKISVLEQTMYGSQSDIKDALAKEKEKSESLVGQLSEVANTVGALSKLSKTDPELLKKYSKVYFLNEHYVPISLAKIDAGYVNTNSKNNEIHSDVFPFLKSLIDAGKDSGVNLLVQSAYRSFGTQAILKSNYKVIYGAGTANSFSADQGYSEHQLGTAIDLTTQKTNGALEGFDKTPEFKWLKDNAYKYGFILSYPSGNKYYKYEPWHWRFVGVALATKLFEDKENFYNVDQRIIDNYLSNIFDPIPINP